MVCLNFQGSEGAATIQPGKRQLRGILSIRINICCKGVKKMETGSSQ